MGNFGPRGRRARPGGRIVSGTGDRGDVTPLIDECYANLECRVVDSRMAARYDLFILEVVKAWVDPSVKRPRTIHHLGGADFMVAGRAIRLPSKMK